MIVALLIENRYGVSFCVATGGKTYRQNVQTFKCKMMQDIDAGYDMGGNVEG